MSRSNFFEGFITGAVLGGIIAVLYAPQSGEETRNRLQELKNEREDLIQDTKDRTENLIEKTRDAIEEGFDKISTLIEDNKKRQPGDANN